MNIFATKKEATVTIAIAAFFVLLTLAFTFEPLGSVIVKSKDLPEGTIISSRIPAFVGTKEFVNEGGKILAGLGISQPSSATIRRDAELVAKAVKGQKTLNISVSPDSGFPYILELIGETAPDVQNPLKIISARYSPSENKVLMPDRTSYIEYLADPEKADLEKLPIPLSLKSEAGITTISMAKKPLKRNNYYSSPIGCENSELGIKTIYFAKLSDSFVNIFISSIPHYLANFSCFQSFSTIR